jgi:GNAT superfamily N-acetyltransferase
MNRNLVYLSQKSQALLWQHLAKERFFNTQTHYCYTGINRSFFNVVNLFQEEININIILDFYKAKKISWSWWVESTSKLYSKTDLLASNGMDYIYKASAFLINPAQKNKNISSEYDTLFISSSSKKFDDWIKIFSEVFNTSIDKTNMWGARYKLLNAKNSFIHCLVYKKQIPVGIGTLYINPLVSVILNLGVTFSERKKGIATYILSSLLEYCKNNSIKYVTLSATENAESLYKNYGFAQIYSYKAFQQVYN